VKAGVSAVAAVGRHDVRGVAGQEDAPLLEAVGNIGHRLPAHDVLDGDVDVVGTQACVYEVDAALLVEVPDVRDRILRVARRVHHEKAGVVRLLDAEEARKDVVHDQDHAQVAPAQDRLDVCA
jgi:hypothetical protein